MIPLSRLSRSLLTFVSLFTEIWTCGHNYDITWKDLLVANKVKLMRISEATGALRYKLTRCCFAYLVTILP